jgi:putative zinc finger/helix-turn-helix YgiT family protein
MSPVSNEALCPECEKGHMRETSKDLIFTYKGHEQRFPNMKIFLCDVCGHERLPEKVQENIDKELTDLRRNVEGLLRSGELKAIRKELGLKKKAMAGLLSVDAKTVGRYENGRIIQSKQIDILYRIFRAVPTAWTVVMAGSGTPMVFSSKPDDIVPGGVSFTVVNSGSTHLPKHSAATMNTTTYLRTLEGELQLAEY